MERIASFCVDHNTLVPGMYLSRKDGDVLTWDIRMKTPNKGSYLSPACAHTIEHLFATYARNSKWSEHVIYVGPMGCLTGFYLLTRFPAVHNTEPVQQFVSVFDNLVPGWLALTLAVVLVVISQIKINVTNAYSGSLAWTSAWTRTTKRYPGRIIFVVVNLAIALALMEGDMFSALSWILGFYSNFAIAWVVVVATDITFNKGLLKLAPAQPEYRRGMIYNVNPVGVVSFGLAAGLSICAFFGLLGATLAPFSPLIALVVAFVMTPLMGLLTRGRYYIKQVDDGIAEPRYDAAGNASTTVYQCVSCEEEYERPDVMHSHKHQGAICSLCKSME